MSDKKLAILYFVLFSVNALAMCFIAAFTGVDWDDLSTTQKAVVISAMVANWTGTILAFLSKVMGRLGAGKPLIDPNDVTVTETKTVTGPNASSSSSTLTMTASPEQKTQ